MGIDPIYLESPGILYVEFIRWWVKENLKLFLLRLRWKMKSGWLKLSEKLWHLMEKHLWKLQGWGGGSWQSHIFFLMKETNNYSHTMQIIQKFGNNLKYSFIEIKLLFWLKMCYFLWLHLWILVAENFETTLWSLKIFFLMNTFQFF